MFRAASLPRHTYSGISLLTLPEPHPGPYLSSAVSSCAAAAHLYLPIQTAGEWNASRLHFSPSCPSPPARPCCSLRGGHCPQASERVLLASTSPAGAGRREAGLRPHQAMSSGTHGIWALTRSVSPPLALALLRRLRAPFGSRVQRADASPPANGAARSCLLPRRPASEGTTNGWAMPPCCSGGCAASSASRAALPPPLPREAQPRHPPQHPSAGCLDQWHSPGALLRRGLRLA